ncbi:MAG: ATP synthase F1 subunit epsilon [Clostridiales Family XIII bacterium]|jgi:F-type H+-transporting ATPase subunit epsilon|nr:ATP synthase F1 subunit epsilon [Clostridiales Family XIII bacterium]
MAKSFKLDIVTPERLFYEGDVELVILRTTGGDEGFMANHSWACKLLDVGEIWIQEAGQKDFKIAAGSPGFVDVKGEVMVFVDAAEWQGDIDLSRAQNEKERAEAILNSRKGPVPSDDDDEEYKQAQVSLNKALNRMKVAKGGRRAKA